MAGKKYFGICLLSSVVFLQFSNSHSAFVKPNEIDFVSSDIILIESSSRARAIIRQFEKGAERCSKRAIEQRTACVADALKRASRVGSSRGFGNGRTPAAIKKASERMDNLPDDGSLSSRQAGIRILNNLSSEIKGIAKLRPPEFQKYQLQVSEKVAVLIDPLKKKS